MKNKKEKPVNVTPEKVEDFIADTVEIAAALAKYGSKWKEFAENSSDDILTEDEKERLTKATNELVKAVEGL